jgi:hypothetical protein
LMLNALCERTRGERENRTLQVEPERSASKEKNRSAPSNRANSSSVGD